MKTISREYKKKKALKKLIERYALISETSLERTKIGIAEKHLSMGGMVRTYNNGDDTVKTYRLKVSFNMMNHRVKTQKLYTNSYYVGRSEKLRFAIKNYKIMRRFVILHELGHINCFGKWAHHDFNKICRYKVSRIERYADAFALRYIKILEAKRAVTI